MIPPNQNSGWTSADLELLQKLWSERASLDDMMLALGRSGSSVLAQLTIRGYLYFSQKTQAFHLASPLWTVKDVQRADRRVWSDTEHQPLQDPPA